MNQLKTVNFIANWGQTWKKQGKLKWLLAIFGLLLLNFIAFIWNLGNTGLVDETEPLFAEAARQMTITGDWITPYFNEETRFDKPALIYWLMAIFYRLIGVNEWAARLPSALAAIILSCFCFLTLRYFGFTTPALSKAKTQKKPKNQHQLWISAWIGSALVILNTQTIFWARIGVSDMLLSGCMGMALLCFFWGYVSGSGKSVEVKYSVNNLREKPIIYPPNTPPLEKLKSILLSPIANGWYWGFYLFSGLAVLTKGPVGIVLPGLIIVVFLLYVNKFREVLPEMGILWGGLVFLLVALPWYILVTIANGNNFLNSFFGYHNFERFTQVVNGHAAPWYFYFLIVLAMFAPWSVYLPLGIINLRFWKRSVWCQQPRWRQLSLFAFCWFACIFVFFTVATTKLPSYVLPLIPAAAIIVALVWSQEFTRNLSLIQLGIKGNKNTGLVISILLNITLLLGVAIASFYLPRLIGSDTAMKNLSQLIQQLHFPIRGTIIWGTTAILSIFLLRNRQYWRWIICVNIVGFLAFIIFMIQPGYLLMDRVRQLPLRQISEVVNQVRQPNEKLMMIGFKKPTVVFYTQQPVGYFWTIDEPARDFLHQLPADSTVLLLGQPDQIAEAGLTSTDYQLLGQQNPYLLIRVSKQRLLD